MKKNQNLPQKNFLKAIWILCVSMLKISIAQSAPLDAACDEVMQYKPAQYESNIISAYFTQHCEIDLPSKQTFNSVVISNQWLAYIFSATDMTKEFQGNIADGGLEYRYVTKRTVSNALYSATTEALENLKYYSDRMIYTNDSIRIIGSGVSSFAKSASVRTEIYLKQRPNGIWYLSYDTFTNGKIQRPPYLPQNGFKKLVLSQSQTEIKKSVQTNMDILLHIL